MKIFVNDPETDVLQEDDLSPQDLEEIRTLFEKRHPRAPRFDNVHGYQQLSEIDCVRDLAKEMNKRGHSIPLDKINANPNDPPDCFAEMNGQPIAVEVTKAS